LIKAEHIELRRDDQLGLGGIYKIHVLDKFDN